ncbi:MAG: hypothetical protein M1828_007663 [Chrysothrix sp. TS-e1954]|nr:MAG: hypothetical protein M1828_007663 [Chrysothrix sp. TS-e1954]
MSDWNSGTNGPSATWNSAADDGDDWGTGTGGATNTSYNDNAPNNADAFNENNNVEAFNAGSGGNPDWFSKHADDADFKGGKDNKCRNCGQEGHFSRDCTEEKKNTGECFNCGETGHNKIDCPNPKSGGGGLTGECFNCGEVGHNKADCTNPKVDRPFTGECFNCGETGHSKADCTNPKVDRPFTGTCRLCNEEGHRASECPTAPPTVCKLCGENGHKAKACENPRPIDYSGVPDMSVDEAWEIIKASHDDEESQLREFAEKLKILCKADRQLSWLDVEKQLRARKLNKYFIIACEAQAYREHTFVNLQGKIDCTHQIFINTGFRPRYKASWKYWPKSPLENVERLEDAGVPMELGIPVCKRCNGTSLEESVINFDLMKDYRARAYHEILLSGGNRGGKEVGHFAKDCPNGGGGGACRNCGQEGHFAKDCDQPRAVKCRNCEQDGHMAKDCDQPRVMKCRNCDEVGHMSKECPKPTDWSRVKCSNCEQFGHSYRRCNEPPKESQDEGFDNPSNGVDNSGFGAEAPSAEWNNSSNETAQAGSWDAPATADTSTAVAAGGAWSSGADDGW